jgi:hypothetical protein
VIEFFAKLVKQEVIECRLICGITEDHDGVEDGGLVVTLGLYHL